jgi:hypothetical protein
MQSTSDNGQGVNSEYEFRKALGEENPELNDRFNAIVREALEGEPPAADPRSATYEAILDTRRFNANKPPPFADPIYKLCGKVICTPGNLTAISAHIKSGKTAFICSFGAASLGLEGDTLSVKSSNPDALAVLHFDTEQSPFDHYTVVAKALSRVGIKKPPTWFKSYSLTEIEPKQRFALLEWEMRRAKAKHGGIHSVLLDGGADFLRDVNDVKESMSSVARLHMLAI